MDIVMGSHTTPPFEPPNGMLTSAHFQVIQAASAFTSSSVTFRSKRMPPLAGPRDVRLRRIRRPAGPQLHRIFLRDYNIIGVLRGPREAGDIAGRIGVMVLIRRELHAGTEGAHLRGEADRIGDPRRDDDPAFRK